MIRLAAVVLAAVELGAGFGDASATVESTTGESMVIDIHVEVIDESDVVVAHFALPDEAQITIPLLPREDGTYGVTTELKPANYQVVFEAVGDPGAQSDPVTLADLGADLESMGEMSDEDTSAETSQWLWLGVALGAASLSALAFWVLGARDEEEDDEEAESQSSPEEPTSVS